ncbi:Iron-sulfur cluster assembly protein [Candidatus Gugararchaeum adminiculabundum]|nr:Iron-sulfur cluster assembly protein [Candidatus Gugararchaeum adminiculabundum]
MAAEPKAQKERLREKVMAVLRECYDPELRLNIVDLGLIYGVEVDRSTVKITMTLTSPACPLYPQMRAEIEQKVMQIPGVKDIEIELVFDPPWSIDKASEDVRALMGL